MRPTTRRLSREESQHQTRQRLLDAARQEIIRHGVGAASVRNISEAAGFSQGAFYSNFESKEAMLLELMQGHMQQEAAAFRAIIEEAPPEDVDEILARVTAWLRGLRSDRSLSMLALELQMQANRSPDFAAAYNRSKSAYLAGFAGAVTRLFERRNLVPAIDPLQIAIGLNALWSGFAIQGTVADALPAEEIMVFFLRALIASAPVRGPA